MGRKTARAHSARWGDDDDDHDDDGHDDDDHDDNDDDDNDDDDHYADIYIMMKSVCVCLSRKIITSNPPELSAGGAKRDAI